MSGRDRGVKTKKRKRDRHRALQKSAGSTSTKENAVTKKRNRLVLDLREFFRGKRMQRARKKKRRFSREFSLLFV